MQIHHKKSLFIPLVSGLIVTTTGLIAAPTISWVPASTSVPMSLSSLIILAILFMGAGLYLLMKSQNAVARSLFSILLLAGMFGFVKEVKADMATCITLSSPSGSEILGIGNHIVNDAQNVPVKIMIDPDELQLVFTDCYNNNGVLQPGDSCDISLNWSGGPF